MRLYRSLRWAGLWGAAALAVAGGAGCGSGHGTIAVTDDDAGPNQRGSLDGGAPDRDSSAGGDGDGGGSDTGVSTADAREAGTQDATATPDAPSRQCTAPARRCDGGTPQTCDDSGTWQASGPACPFACTDGACTGVCVPATFQCVGPNRQLCTATGQWMDYLACPFVCLAGDCAGSCLPARTRCVGGEQQLCSALGEWQTTGVIMRELLTNPGFDDGASGWTNPGVPLVYAANGSGNANTKSTGGDNNGRPEVTAQAGDNIAWLGGLNREDDLLSQDIAIPADASSVTLSFYYVIVSNEDRNASGENDVLDVSLITSDNQEMPLAHLSDNNTVDTWTQFTTAIPPSLAGQIVTLQFHAVTSATQITSFYVDTASVQATACP